MAAEDMCCQISSHPQRESRGCRGLCDHGGRAMKRCVSMAGVVLGVLAFAASSSAATKDYAQTALNIIPSGQYGSAPPPPGADAQAQMYDGLTPLFDQVTPADLTTYFKSERFGVATDGPSTIETVPRASVTSSATSSTSRTSPAPPTTTASGPPAGSPPRTAHFSSSRRATTPASRQSTRRGS